MTNKERFAQLCDQQSLPIFMQKWWMDAVCAGKKWDVLIYTASDIDMSSDDPQQIVAALPYLICKRFWMHFVLMPQQTQIGGVWLAPEIESDQERIYRLAEAIKRSLRKLGLHYYYQHYPVGSPIVGALRKVGFKVEERYTYRIDDLSDMEAVEAAYSKNKRRQITKAAGLHVDTNLTGEEFYRFHTRCMAERLRKVSYTREFLLVLERKAMRHNQCCFLAIRDDDNNILAAAFLVWDAQWMYYLIPCFMISAKESGASARLADEAIRQAAIRKLAFDFEGSMKPGIANHYSQFGSKPSAYYAVSKLYRPSFVLALLINKYRERKIW